MDCLFLPCICGTEPKTEALSPPVYNCPVCQVILHFFILFGSFFAAAGSCSGNSQSVCQAASSSFLLSRPLTNCVTCAGHAMRTTPVDRRALLLLLVRNFVAVILAAGIIQNSLVGRHALMITITCVALCMLAHTL